MSYSFFATGLTALATLSAVRAAEHRVIVGGPDNLTFQPPRIDHAQPGDSIIFSFRVKNHTVTQSTLASPCNLLEGGFASGFKPVEATLTEGFPEFSIPVHDHNPIWAYCGQGNHCQQGMLFAVNGGEQVGQFWDTATDGTVPAPPPQDPAPPVEGGEHPAEPSVVTVTATVTEVGGEVWTTTYGSWPGSPEPTSPQSTEHRVTVGANGQFLFEPSNIQAQQGDTVLFEFHAKNHTVTQSTFNAPCVNSRGFNSDFRPVEVGVTDNLPTFSITINDTKPIWAYCAQGNHCGQGMVFSVNAVESGPNNFAAFLENARGTNDDGATPPPGGDDDDSAGNEEGQGQGGGSAFTSIPSMITFFAIASASYALL